MWAASMRRPIISVIRHWSAGCHGSPSTPSLGIEPRTQVLECPREVILYGNYGRQRPAVVVHWKAHARELKTSNATPDTQAASGAKRHKQSFYCRICSSVEKIIPQARFLLFWLVPSVRDAELEWVGIAIEDWHEASRCWARGCLRCVSCLKQRDEASSLA